MVNLHVRPRRILLVAVLLAPSLAACSVDRPAGDGGGSTSSTGSGLSETSATPGATDPGATTAGGVTSTGAADGTTDPGASGATGADGSASAAISGSGSSASDTTGGSTTGDETTEAECHDREILKTACAPYPENCPAQPPWPPTRCGDVVCAEGEICVVEEELICCESGLLLSSTDDTSTGSTTDSEKDTPGPDWWVGECVGAALCDGSLFPDYWDGHLFCPANHGCY